MEDGVTDIDNWQPEAYDSERLRDLHVGPNDVLVVRVRTVGVAPAHVSSFLRKVKEHLHSVWTRVGIADRVLYEAGSEQGFSVIHVRQKGLEKAGWKEPMRKKMYRAPEPPIIG